MVLCDDDVWPDESMSVLDCVRKRISMADSLMGFVRRLVTEGAMAHGGSGPHRFRTRAHGMTVERLYRITADGEVTVI